MSLEALYVHVPFCRAKCTYCDFVAFAHREADISSYVHQIEAEIASWAPEAHDSTIGTVFFGGGTPSLLPPGELARLLDCLHQNFDVAPDAEISIEANPSSTTPARLAAWRAAGVNRLSFGVQTFDAARLRLLGRLHGPEGARQAFRDAREAGFDNLSVDLIYGLPNQTPEDVERDLEAALDLAPDHVSAYCLTIEPGTPLARQVKAGLVAPLDDDTQADMYVLAERVLASAGYQHYEISNWALPGRECRHNIVYWENGEFLGLGPGAYSRWNGRRFAMTGDLDRYLGHDWSQGCGDLIETAAVLDPVTDARETAMLWLRLDRGLNRARFRERFGPDALADVRASLGEPIEWGLVDDIGGCWFLTARGRLLSNEVFGRILSP